VQLTPNSTHIVRIPINNIYKLTFVKYRLPLVGTPHLPQAQEKEKSRAATRPNPSKVKDSAIDPAGPQERDVRCREEARQGRRHTCRAARTRQAYQAALAGPHVNSPDCVYQMPTQAFTFMFCSILSLFHIHGRRAGDIPVGWSTSLRCDCKRGTAPALGRARPQSCPPPLAVLPR
jgi:hypothetical protein